MVPLLNALFVVGGVGTDAEGTIQMVFTGKFSRGVFSGSKSPMSGTKKERPEDRSLKN
jgi:hypothetical protein